MVYRSGAAGSILATRVFYTTHVKISQKDTSSQQACSKSVNDRVVTIVVVTLLSFHQAAATCRQPVATCV